MHETTKTIEIADMRFQIRRLPADVGSFILMQLMGAAASGAAHMVGDMKDVPAQEKEQTGEIKKSTGADTVRTLAMAAFMRGINFEAFRFVQRQCLLLVSREDATLGFIPIMTDDGRWEPVSSSKIGASLDIVMKLTMEVLVFNYSDFFEQGGMDSLSTSTKTQDGNQ
jgi:hypothetical protein